MKNSNLLNYKGYSAKPEYIVDDKIFYGKILGITDFVDFYSTDAEKIEEEFHQAVDDYLDFCKEVGKKPQKEFTGTFNVRISQDLHRKAYMKAQAEGVSLNKIVEQILKKSLDNQSDSDVQKNQIEKMYPKIEINLNINEAEHETDANPKMYQESKNESITKSMRRC